MRRIFYTVSFEETVFLELITLSAFRNRTFSAVLFKVRDVSRFLGAIEAALNNLARSRLAYLNFGF